MTPAVQGRVTPRITRHAVQRWTERVSWHASPSTSYRQLAEFLEHGHRRPRPRHWTDVAPAPGLTFVYWAARPGVCVLVVDGVAVTVLTRALGRRDRRRPPAHPDRRPRQQRRNRSIGTGR